MKLNSATINNFPSQKYTRYTTLIAKKKKKLHITSSKHLKTEEHKNNNKLKKKPVHKHIGKISTAIIQQTENNIMNQKMNNHDKNILCSFLSMYLQQENTAQEISRQRSNKTQKDRNQKIHYGSKQIKNRERGVLLFQIRRLP